MCTACVVKQPGGENKIVDWSEPIIGLPDGRVTTMDMQLLLALFEEYQRPMNETVWLWNEKLDDLVDAWHERPEDGPLHEFLNMSWDEYGAWTKDPNEIPVRWRIIDPTTGRYTCCGTNAYSADPFHAWSCPNRKNT